jgi:hypothetical protein
MNSLISSNWASVSLKMALSLEDDEFEIDSALSMVNLQLVANLDGPTGWEYRRNAGKERRPMLTAWQSEKHAEHCFGSSINLSLRTRNSNS